MQRQPQPRTDDENDEIEQPERAPSPLSARELQAPESEKRERDPEEPVEKQQRKTPASANQKRSRDG